MQMYFFILQINKQRIFAYFVQLTKDCNVDQFADFPD